MNGETKTVDPESLILESMAADTLFQVVTKKKEREREREKEKKKEGRERNPSRYRRTRSERRKRTEAGTVL